MKRSRLKRGMRRMKMYNFRVDRISKDMVKLLSKTADEEGLEYEVKEVSVKA